MDARQQVIMEIEDCEIMVRTISADLDEISSSETLDPARYSEVRAELDKAQSKLEAKRAELADIDAAGSAAQAELSAALDAIDLGGETVSLRHLAADEPSYQLIYIVMQERFTAQAQNHAQIVTALKSSYAADQAELQRLREAHYQLIDRCADLESKHKAAADQLQEEKEEKDRLKVDNDNLRKQLADSGKPQETNMTVNAQAALAAWKNSRTPITNKRWKDEFKKTHYLAELASTGETIDIPYLSINLYREVSEAEAESFRAEHPAPVETNPVPDTTLDGSDIEPPALQFPEIEVPVDVQAESALGELVLSPEEVTRRILALEKRVNEIVGVEAVA